MSIPFDTYILIVFLLALAGFIFSGYLSFVKLVTKKCAFNETCPLFFGAPACWFGFLMFIALLGTASFSLVGYLSATTATNTLMAISFLGTVFAGYLTLQELFEWIHSRSKRFELVFPTCTYGMLFYIVIFILSLIR